MPRMRRRDIIVAAITVALTLFAGLVALNFRTGEKQIEQKVARLYATQDAQFARAMGVLLGPADPRWKPVRGAAEWRRDISGDARGDPRRAATISFESTSTGRDDRQEFAEALAERARAGVKVHVLLDWVGSSKIDQQLARSRWSEAGVEVGRFHAPQW